MTKPFFWMPGVFCIALAGCVPPPTDLSQVDIARRAAALECGGPGEARCTFVNSPVRLLPEPVRLSDRPFDFFPTAEKLDFVDAVDFTWSAPPRTLTDGASIPQIFVHMIGNPRSPEFINAAAMHDAYCGIGNETLKTYQSRSWPETHAMFYDALRAGGTPEIKAGLMYAAVYLGGPRWDMPNRNLDNVPVARMQTAMALTERFIRSNRPAPTRAAIAGYIDDLEPWLLLRKENDEPPRGLTGRAPESSPPPAPEPETEPEPEPETQPGSETGTETEADPGTDILDAPVDIGLGAN